MRSPTGWEGFRRLPGFPADGALERLERGGFVEMHDEVELIRQPCDEVLAAAFIARKVDDADGAFEARGAHGAREHGVVAERQQHPFVAAVVKQPLTAAS